VTVRDEEVAERELLRRILSDDAVRVTTFGRRRYQLEEVFVNLIEGTNGR